LQEGVIQEDQDIDGLNFENGMSQKTSQMMMMMIMMVVVI
jgi:hypothetical protein